MVVLGWLAALLSWAVLGQAGLRDGDIFSRDGDGEQSYPNPPGGAAKPLECFQPSNPVLSPEGLEVDTRTFPERFPDIADSCDVLLMEHSFANSYGQPYVASYTPPKCSFNRVIFNFTVVSEGRQFDRLAIMYLGNVEVWRTSTAEPTAHPGILWTYWKDMTSYLSLWKQPQTIIFDLGNIVDDTYTGPFNTTLTATFFNDKQKRSSSAPADVILPFSNGMGTDGAASAFVYPENAAVSSIKLPHANRVNRAVFSVAATGQAAEEFWWSNVPESSKNALGANITLPGLSSFREVQLLIDGQLAGLSWPFPVIFTGGISPPLHRPLVGLQAFDLREQEIDITPWLGILSDGREHEFSLQVFGIDDRNASWAQVPSNWVLTGKLFLWEQSHKVTRYGGAPEVSVSPLKLEVKQDVASGKLVYNQLINRKISVFDRNSRQTWSQKFSMANYGVIKDQGNYQYVKAKYAGEDQAATNARKYYYAGYEYPIDTTYEAIAPDGQWDLTLTADLVQGFDYTQGGPSAFVTGLEPWYPKYKPDGVQIKTSRNASAIFHQYAGGTKSTGVGSAHQIYELGSKNKLSNPNVQGQPDVLLYKRDVSVNNSTVLYDRQHFANLGGWSYDGSHRDAAVAAASGQFAPLASSHGPGLKRFRDKWHGGPGVGLYRH